MVALELVSVSVIVQSLSHDYLPMIPVDTIAKALMFTLQILAIKVAVVTGGVPPGSLEPLGTVLAPRVVVTVHRTELGPLLGQTLTKLSVNVAVDNSEPAKVDTDRVTRHCNEKLQPANTSVLCLNSKHLLVELCSNNKIIHRNLSLSSFPILQLDQQLLRLISSLLIK